MQSHIPKYTIKEFFPKKHKYCVCVFIINEGEKVQKQLKNMVEHADTVDIIIADGGSTDGSLDHDFLSTVSVRTLLTKTDTGKLSAQMRMAFDYASREDYEGVIVVDGNGKDDISAIPRFIEKLEEGYDHIQGSRYIPGGLEENTPRSRKWGVILLHAPVISLASRFRYTDTTNGFRAYSMKLLEDKNIHIYREVFNTYELHYYLAIEAARRGYKCIEIPVTRRYPASGKIPTKIKGIRGNTSVLKILFKAALGHYSHKK